MNTRCESRVGAALQPLFTARERSSSRRACSRGDRFHSGSEAGDEHGSRVVFREVRAWLRLTREFSRKAVVAGLVAPVTCTMSGASNRGPGAVEKHFVRMGHPGASRFEHRHVVLHGRAARRAFRMRHACSTGADCD